MQDTKWTKTKKSRVAVPKTALVAMLYAFKCANCDMKLTFEQVTLDHIEPRLGNAMVANVNHKVENLVVLCRKCNSEKSNSGIEWYKPSVQAFIGRVSKWANNSQNPNHIGVILKTPILNIDNKLVTKANHELLCDAIAMKYPHNKFARAWKNGIFAIPRS